MGAFLNHLRAVRQTPRMSPPPSMAVEETEDELEILGGEDNLGPEMEDPDMEEPEV